ncbi:exosortase C-terminal domain/associated protein EpsI [Desulfovibrio psychrotolerans]|uniref:EpsI family protein n=1 Tax=Desulfovibrio psychrotolerans TaxID=415242 RepID=A0A7J0BVY2_9BACT|nr:exosortase C-terminal domain/associated protein EpsI [Desulfovibrio psychrotolerans]GFM37332.1 EpsI family protein [Desulfovibrio psychrotolerans]
MQRRLLIACALLLMLGGLTNFHENLNVPLARPLKEFPQQVNGWRQVQDVTFSEGILGVLRATDYLFRDYVDAGGRRMNLYIGFHDGGPKSGPIHSPRNCLPGSGWQLESQRPVTVSGPDGEVEVVRAEYSKDGETTVFYYWFSVRDRVVTDEYSLKLMELFSSLTMRRKDSSFIRVAMDQSVEMDGDGAAFKLFFREFYPLIREFLPS